MSDPNPNAPPRDRDTAALARPCEGCGADAGEECMPLSLCGLS
ncbi:hypothetical protein [Streptomyces scabiei]|nr:hypothetical protein [Streptomyces scabiei]MDX3126569.1 hypothetical protein [Streptomyces scabiei]MDX3203020.1 hypothetical protein [Streptomyces scabiei]MDX3223143.1 hypothetical protein [Streptomyces scabiei]